jgi:hypothetical protein
MNAACREQFSNWGRPYAELREHNAYGWKCWHNPADDGWWMSDVDLPRACRVQHPDAPYANFRDYSNPFSWYCHN